MNKGLLTNLQIQDETIYITDDMGTERLLRDFPPRDLEGFIEWVEFELAYLIERLEDRNPNELAMHCVLIWEIIN